MILTVGNTKGGVGKTTLAVQLAIARARAGRDVWLIDADLQGTASAAIAARGQSGHQPMIACSQYVEGQSLRSQITHQARKWDDIIIDAGGRDSGALRMAMTLSDILLVPFAPRSYDVWALDQMGALITDVRESNPGLRSFAVMNQADPGSKSTDNADAEEAVREVAQLEYLSVPIRRRKAFSNAGGSGISVNELPAKDPKASAEIANLAEVLFNIQTTSKAG